MENLRPACKHLRRCSSKFCIRFWSSDSQKKVSIGLQSLVYQTTCSYQIGVRRVLAEDAGCSSSLWGSKVWNKKRNSPSDLGTPRSTSELSTSFGMMKLRKADHLDHSKLVSSKVVASNRKWTRTASITKKQLIASNCCQSKHGILFSCNQVCKKTFWGSNRILGRFLKFRNKIERSKKKSFFALNHHHHHQWG